jgi:quinoprotein glucose dehydrogenase
MANADTVVTREGMKALVAFIARRAATDNTPQTQVRRGGFVLPPGAPLPNGEARRFYGQFGNYWYDSNGLNMIKPPWAELIAYDLNQGTIKWRIPLGTAPGLAAKGIKDTGAVNVVKNGVVVTKGGLIFMGTEGDRTVRAYDKDTGKTLWERELESNPESIPAVYEVGGRQYVAFFCKSDRWPSDNWAHKVGKPEAQGYYVFALPKAVVGVK